jgi:hypothetical protein
MRRYNEIVIHALIVMLLCDGGKMTVSWEKLLSLHNGIYFPIATPEKITCLYR